MSFIPCFILASIVDLLNPEDGMNHTASETVPDDAVARSSLF